MNLIKSFRRKKPDPSVTNAWTICLRNYVYEFVPALVPDVNKLFDKSPDCGFPEFDIIEFDRFCKKIKIHDILTKGSGEFYYHEFDMCLYNGHIFTTITERHYRLIKTWLCINKGVIPLWAL